MKDSLFEILLNLFEKTLTEIKESQSLNTNIIVNEAFDDADDESLVITNESTQFIKSASHKSQRILTYDEQIRLTKASYQYLMRLLVWKVICADQLELILSQLIFSDSRIVRLEETKWTIRNVLSESLNAQQLAFLDLVLYQKNDVHALH